MSLLANYYAAQGEELRARTAQSFAQAGLIDQQAGQVGPDAAARRALEGAQTGAAQAGAANTTAQTAQVAPNAASNRQLDLSRANQNDVNSRLAPGQVAADIAAKNASTDATRVGTAVAAYNGLPTLPTMGGFVPAVGTLGGTGLVDPTKAQGFSRGGKVKPQAIQGKGKPGPTDTVPTMLTPNEAVLNKGAVEHYGTDVIDHMNKMGLMRMAAQSEHAQLNGQPDPHAPPAAKPAKKTKGD